MREREMQNTPTSLLLIFFIVTACVTTAQGIVGTLLWPEARFGFDAFLFPPLFGILSVLSNVVLISKKELSMGQMAFRMFLQLLVIEVMVFSVNILVGSSENYTPAICILLAGAVAGIYGVVHVIMWLNDRRVAKAFNERLRRFQEEIQ